VADASVPVLEAKSEPKVGEYIGQCKWWSDKHGYGFVTVTSDGEMKGKEIFLHYSGIRPLNSNYRTLKKGEYVNFDITTGPKGMQGTNVTGIGGGSLICDVNPYVKPVPRATQPPPPPPSTHSHSGYHTYTVPQHTIASAAYITHASGGGFRNFKGAGRGNAHQQQRVVRPYYKPKVVQNTETA